MRWKRMDDSPSSNGSYGYEPTGDQPGQKGFDPVDDLIARQVDVVSAGTRFLQRVEYLQRHCVLFTSKG
jgi:hypothetical protein